MNTIGPILFMIILLISGIGYTIYNYCIGKLSQMMLIFSIGLLGAALVNMVQGLIRAWRAKDE